MRSALQTPADRAARLVVVWLLALLIPLQGIAAGVITVLGPAHTHGAVAGSRLVLDDLRRASVRIEPRITHVATGFGHFHASAERHRHGPGDETMNPLAGDPWQHTGDADEASLSPALGAFLALLPSPAASLPAAARDAPALHAAWPALTHDPEPFERPPRRA